MKLKDKLKRAWKWYVKGCYHCDKCPYCWSEWSYEGDGDAGCYIFGDLKDTCRLLPPIRTLIGWSKKKKAEYYFNHEYDGFAEWYEEDEKRGDKFNDLVIALFERYEICWKDDDGTYHPIDKEGYIRYEGFRARRDYDDFCYPFAVKTLRQEWKELIAKTIRRFINIFKPYVCK